MRRLLSIAAVLVVCGGAVVLAAASGGDSQGVTYKVVFDNAFGLVEGGDFRVGGVTAGQTTAFAATDDAPPKAEVTVEITEPGFADFRSDATCEIRPQSLIGEYYVDCQPGQAEDKLAEGGTVPVEQTQSTIPTDLVNNVLRRPYRERFRLIVTELGTGLAGRPQDLQEVLQRAHPGLRETSRTLRILGDQNQVIENFIRDSDTVVAAPYTRDLGEAARSLNAAAPDLTQSFEKLNRFFNIGAFNPGGAEPLEGLSFEGQRDRREGYLYWTAWASQIATSAFANGDAQGNFRRVMVGGVNCTTFVAAGLPKPVSELLGQAGICAGPGAGGTPTGALPELPIPTP